MATSLLDTSYSQPRRFVSPIEQQVHAYLETLPLFAFGIVVVLYWGEWRDPAWSFAARAMPLPRGALAATLLALLVTLLLIGEEYWRCARGRVAHRDADV
jgi:hypothetical protein